MVTNLFSFKIFFKKYLGYYGTGFHAMSNHIGAITKLLLFPFDSQIDIQKVENEIKEFKVNNKKKILKI
jgi:hypothetical protein